MNISIRCLKILSLVFLFLWLWALLFQKIDLSTADIGRHLKNGEIVLKSFAIQKTNLYSYTFSDYPTQNHHWGSGVLFYLIYKAAGFAGLSLFYIASVTLAFTIFLWISAKKAGWKSTLISTFLLLPLVAFRKEVRPEGLSYILVALFFFILLRSNSGSLGKRHLLLLSLIQVFWTNLHIYFFLGPAIVGIFFLEKLLYRAETTGYYLFAFLLTTAAAILNPSGLSGAIYPLTIMGSYGYRLVENQSVWFLESIGYSPPEFLIFKIALVVILLSFIISIIINRRLVHISFVLIALLSIVFGTLAIRNLTLFALLGIPTLSYFLNQGLLKTKFKTIISGTMLVVFFFLSAFISIKDLTGRKDRFGIGLMQKSLSSIEFFRQNSFSGPIFNNYDIGGLLIFGLFPEEKVFVDNRPESYPSDFFTKTYIPMQENSKKWQQSNIKYDFQTIFFSHRDMTPWGQKFLIDRVRDTDWVPVYADRYAIIFVRNIDKNKKIIENYAIPKDDFKIIKTDRL